MRQLFPLMLLFCITSAHANDGAFYAKGNQLIPILEKTISLQKEILTIKKVDNEWIDVTVYYELFNPGKAKTVLVGFEAQSPGGDVDGTPVNGRHPYMQDFTVNLNNQILNYDVAIINDSSYLKTGQFNTLNKEEIEIASEDVNAVGFYYAYHFNATLKKGLNTIVHTYRYRISSSVEMVYDFSYVLTAANRWANKQIDDFTLILDLGNYETFYVEKTFFQSQQDWFINGIAKVLDIKANPERLLNNDALKFHLQKGDLHFTAKNFHPKGELNVFAFQYFNFESETDFAFPIYFQEQHSATTEFELKALKNLPYARRGCVFNDPKMQAFFEQQEWYLANPSYIPNKDQLTEEEKNWLESMEEEDMNEEE